METLRNLALNMLVIQYVVGSALACVVLVALAVSFFRR